MWSFISWIIVGLIAGAIAKAIMPGKQGGGIIATIILGVVGALVGGFLGGLFTDGGIGKIFANPWSLGTLFTSVIGALVFLVVYGFLTKRSGS
ncbi:GlsB/YeaQ/YmgE family stress response membrane protein [Devriesea agamarum]|uniref:GlsB/YeaQ/YmgE family stress response membrane protein n=1 Tax=Devriesea agamarum TaxID=472569 RepID=UPI00071E3B7B|nr:GlsB/YeaQ/YmgE family stress response membrane protein [Devriesea agamarum]